MKYYFIGCLLVISLVLPSCTSSVRFADTEIKASRKQAHSSTTVDKDVETKEYRGETFRGKASYYAEKFHGRRTASGEIYDMNKLTAAHKELPFGTKVAVKNLQNGKVVVVEITDRGPFVSGRVIDLSKAAAEEIDMIRAGVVDVEITVIK